jgi:hypothetical protein
MTASSVHVCAGSDAMVDLSGSLGALPSSQREVVERYLQEKLEMMVQVSVYSFVSFATVITTHHLR